MRDIIILQEQIKTVKLVKPPKTKLKQKYIRMKGGEQYGSK